MNCCKCKKEADIHINNVGEFCSECHNLWISQQYRIVDGSNCDLKENELLQPVKVGYDTLMNELENTIGMMETGDNFIKYSNVTVFETLFYSIYEKIVLMKSTDGYTEEAVKIANAMIERFENLETDDDYFPYNLISLLEEVREK